MGEPGHYVWAWDDESAGRVRARFFPTDLGIAEDEATGAAAVLLGAALGRDLTIRQGVGRDPRSGTRRRQHRRGRTRGADRAPFVWREAMTAAERRDWDAIVVGSAGSVAAVCWLSTRLGDRVLGLEQFELGHAERGTTNSRIIRYSYHRPDYVRLARRIRLVGRRRGGGRRTGRDRHRRARLVAAGCRVPDR